MQFPGILYVNSEVGFGDITDGTTNTFVVGERDGAPLSPQFTRAASTWCGANKAQWMNQVLGPTTSNPQHTLNSTDASGVSSQWYAFSSLHPGGANFGRADGSVEFVSDTIDGDVYEAMGTKAGGEVLSLD